MHPNQAYRYWQKARHGLAPERGRGWRQRLNRLALLLGAMLWATALLGMLTWQHVYAATPGIAAVAPGRWPGDAALPFHPGQYNLLIFVHPHCPCSSATLTELARILARRNAAVDARVLVLRYGDEPSAAGSLYQQAAAIPGVVTIIDPNGAQARRFNAGCSGQTFLYDPRGALLFSGGLTASRGHEGDNPGETAVLALLARALAPLRGGIRRARSCTARCMAARCLIPFRYLIPALRRRMPRTAA